MQKRRFKETECAILDDKAIKSWVFALTCEVRGL